MRNDKTRTGITATNRKIRRPFKGKKGPLTPFSIATTILLGLELTLLSFSISKYSHFSKYASMIDLIKLDGINFLSQLPINHPYTVSCKFDDNAHLITNTLLPFPVQLISGVCNNIQSIILCSTSEYINYKQMFHEKKELALFPLHKKNMIQYFSCSQAMQYSELKSEKDFLNYLTAVHTNIFDILKYHVSKYGQSSSPLKPTSDLENFDKIKDSIEDEAPVEVFQTNTQYL